jgi:hypothetical protein
LSSTYYTFHTLPPSLPVHIPSLKEPQGPLYEPPCRFHPISSHRSIHARVVSSCSSPQNAMDRKKEKEKLKETTSQKRNASLLSLWHMPTTQNARCKTTFLLFSLLSRLRLRYARCDYRRCAVLCSTSVHLLAIRQCFALKMHLSRLLLSPITMHPHPEPRLSLDTQTPHPNHQRAHPHPLAKQALTASATSNSPSLCQFRARR